MEKFKNKSKGITLIALIITIIVLLILAGISIGALTGDNSILKKASNSKESIEIEEEKELVALSVVHSMKKNKLGNIDEEGLQNGLDMNFGEDGAIAIKDGDNYFVVVEESGRIYNVSGDGKVEPEGKIEIDPKAGDITKGGVSKGTSALPYEISCIEDLVAFSKAIGNNEISRSCYAIVTKDLNFKSIYSYGNYKKTYSYDSGKNAYVEDENSTTRLLELCTTGQGFIPIGTKDANQYSGNFDGQGYEIRNIYIEAESKAGLFGQTINTTIKNLGITGYVKSKTFYAGGIVGQGVRTNYYNCYNKATISGGHYSGGLVGHGSWSYATMRNCYNSGKVNSSSSCAGGLAGTFAGEITGSYNLSDISGETYTGGLVGQPAGKITVINCYNIANIESRTTAAGGLFGSGADSPINNSFNVGKVNSLTKSLWNTYARGGGLIGQGTGSFNNELKNSYNIGKLNNRRDGYVLGGKDFYNCYYSSTINEIKLNEVGLIDISDKSLSEFVELLNSYREEKTDEEDNTVQVWPSGWKTWKAGENGYPVFDE